jgi:hypothetical protein
MTRMTTAGQGARSSGATPPSSDGYEGPDFGAGRQRYPNIPFGPFGPFVRRLTAMESFLVGTRSDLSPTTYVQGTDEASNCNLTLLASYPGVTRRHKGNERRARQWSTSEIFIGWMFKLSRRMSASLG